MRVFKAFDGMDQRLLNIKGQAGRDPVRIHLNAVQPFRLNKDLM